MNYSEPFREEARRMMKAKSISGNEMARHLGVAPSTMSEYLSGHSKWPFDAAVRCADYLASDVYKMIGR